MDLDEFFLNTPYLRQIRKQAKIETLLKVIKTRFNPSEKTLQDIEQLLNEADTPEELDVVINDALELNTLEAFTKALGSLQFHH